MPWAQSQIAGAGLDVFWEEPVDPSDPVFEHNVIATPHLGGVTDASYDEIARGLADNVERLRSGQPPINCVNPFSPLPLGHQHLILPSIRRSRVAVPVV